MMLWNERAVIREQRVGKFMENGESLAFCQAAVSILNSELFCWAKKNLSFALNLVTHLFTSNSEEARQFLPGQYGGPVQPRDFAWATFSRANRRMMFSALPSPGYSANSASIDL